MPVAMPVPLPGLIDAVKVAPLVHVMQGDAVLEACSIASVPRVFGGIEILPVSTILAGTSSIVTSAAE
jgi:uncharacterized ParB-like nuclease family protein